METTTNCKICHVGGKIIAAKYYCQDCRALMCGRCKTKHEAKSTHRDHLIVPFAPIINTTCNTHNQERATTWCTTCSSALCLACSSSKHKKHKTFDLKTHLSDWLSDIQSLDQNMDDINVAISGSKEDLDFQIKHLQNLEVHLEKEINENYATIVEKSTNKKNLLIKQMHETIQSQIQKIEKALKIEKDKIQDIAKWVEKKNGTLSGKQEHNLQQIVNKGKVIAAFKPEDVQMPEVLHFLPEDTMEVGRLQNTFPVWETSLKIKSLSALVFTSPTTLLVALTSYCIGALLCEREDESMAFDRQREVLRDHRIQNIAVKRDVFYVTCGHYNCKTVHKCSTTTHELTQRGQWPVGMFSDPFGIAITDSGKVAVSDGDRREVSIHKSNGDRLITVGRDAVGSNTNTKIEFISPWFLSTLSDRIYVSDYDQDTVFVLDLQGNLLFEIGKNGSEDGVFDEQRGMCFTDSGNLLVANRDGVSRFDSNGTFISDVITNKTAAIEQPSFIDFLLHNDKCFLGIIDNDGSKYNLKLFKI